LSTRQTDTDPFEDADFEGGFFDVEEEPVVDEFDDFMDRESEE
jgi:hypothetical protein